MAQTILHKRGLEANLPVLQEAELALTTDLKNLFVGTAEGNVKLAKASELEGLAKSEDLVGLAKTADLEALETQEAAQAKAEAAVASAKTYTDEAINNLRGSAPETLDTLQEIATVIQAIQTEDIATIEAALSNKASSEDVTALDSRLDTIEEKTKTVDGGTF